MEFIIIIALTFIFLYCIVYIAYCCTSTFLSCDSRKDYKCGFTNYSRFMSEIRKTKSNIILWRTDGSIHYYDILHAKIAQIDATSIIFDGNKIMILYPISYLLFLIWFFKEKRKYKKSLNPWRKEK